MTLLYDASLAKKYDSRVVERNIQRGFTKSEDYDKFVKELPDDSANAEFVSQESLEADTRNS